VATVTLHKSIPLLVSLILGTTLLVIALFAGWPFKSLQVQLGLMFFLFYPLGVGLEWIYTRR